MTQRMSVRILFGCGVGLLIGLFVEQPAPAQQSKVEESWSTDVGSAILGYSIEPRMLMRPEGAPWQYEIRIALPRSYKADKRTYPVLYVLDGSLHFADAVSIVAGSSGPDAKLPDMIVVGIGVPREHAREFVMRRAYDFSSIKGGSQCGDFPGPGRELVRQMCLKEQQESVARGAPKVTRTGGAESFLRFISGELRLQIERRYRTSGKNLLWGYSFGGRFCTYVLVSHPASFDEYICGSPSVNAEGGSVFAIEEEYSRSHTDMRARVFFSAGEDEILSGGGVSAAGHVSGMARMAEILRLRNYPSLELHARVIPNQNHTPQGAAASLYAGLRSLVLPKTSRSD